jgi:hypothetical protein
VTAFERRMLLESVDRLRRQLGKVWPGEGWEWVPNRKLAEMAVASFFGESVTAGQKAALRKITSEIA